VHFYDNAELNNSFDRTRTQPNPIHVEPKQNRTPAVRVLPNSTYDAPTLTRKGRWCRLNIRVGRVVLNRHVTSHVFPVSICMG